MGTYSCVLLNIDNIKWVLINKNVGLFSGWPSAPYCMQLSMIKTDTSTIVDDSNVDDDYNDGDDDVLTIKSSFTRSQWYRVLSMFWSCRLSIQPVVQLLQTD